MGMVLRVIGVSAGLAGVGCGSEGAEPAPPLPAGLAFALDRGAAAELWLLPLEASLEPTSGAAIRLDGPDGAPARLADLAGAPPAFQWSPDGRHLAALHGDAGARTLRVLGDQTATAVGFDAVPRQLASRQAWDPAGARLLVVDAWARLWVVAADGGGATRLSTGDVLAGLPHGFERPASTWSPDGRAVAFLEFVEDGPIGHVVTLGGRGGLEVVADVDAEVLQTAWTPTGAGVFVGTSFVCVATGAVSALPAPGQAGATIWSPDGRRLVILTATEAVVAEVAGCAITEAGRVALPAGTARRPPWWTADAQHVVYVDRGDDGGDRLWVLDVAPLAPPRALAGGDAARLQLGEARPLAGGGLAWLEVTADAASGTATVAVRVGDAPARTARTRWTAVVVGGGGHELAPSPDGARLACALHGTAPDRLVIIDVDGDRAPQELKPPAGARTAWSAWSPRADALTFFADGELWVAHDPGAGFGPPRSLGPSVGAWSP